MLHSNRPTCIAAVSIIAMALGRKTRDDALSR
jgi:hypothetical protein